MDRLPEGDFSSEAAHDAMEKLRAVGDDVNKDWSRVCGALRAATSELIEIDDSIKQRLESNFWPTFNNLIKHEKVYNPAVIGEVMARFEEIMAAERQAEMVFFETEVLPKLNRRAFWHGLLGMPYDNMADYEAMMSKRPTNIDTV